MGATMTIGDFAQATRLSAKALRFYHSAGLLLPASVDPRTGYRRYAPEQVADAQVIRALRDLDVPVEEVRQVLAAPDVPSRSAMVAAHLARKEAELAAGRAAVRRLRDLLAPASAPIPITSRSVPATTAVAIRETIDLADLGSWFRSAVAELTALAGSGAIRPTGPCGGLWPTDLVLHERGEAVVYAPVAEAAATPADSDRAVLLRLPAADLAVATSRGPDEEVARAYAALGEHVARHELGVDGPVRESYLEGFPGIDEHTVTEIGWPIFRISR